MWNTSPSMGASEIYLQTQKPCTIPAENGEEYLTNGKEYIEPHKT